jgi:RNA polymerase primary sigma factor
MASKTEETPQKEEMQEKEGPETLPDSPLFDPSDAAVKKLIRSAEKRGYVTHDQINSVLSSERVKSADRGCARHVQRMGINVVETEETNKEGEEPSEEGEEPREEGRARARSPSL